MRIILALAALLVLSGCGSMDFTSVTVSSGYSHYYPSNHISYSLGFYSGHHYNGYRVHGSHGHRYYYAPRHYNNHHYYSAPPVVHHYVRPRPHHVRPHHVTTHYRAPPRNHHNNRNNRNDRQDRRGHRERNRH
jgi:hypothetical protein